MCVILLLQNLQQNHEFGINQGHEDYAKTNLIKT